jgi:membrane fusion protein, heavy metal efflux system
MDLRMTRFSTLLPLVLIGPLLLTACNDAVAPKPEAPAPIVQGNNLRFVNDHPQLALLRVVKAVSAEPISIELPAKLVWNEERTQRIYAAFAGRVTQIRVRRRDAGTTGFA